MPTRTLALACLVLAMAVLPPPMARAHHYTDRVGQRCTTDYASWLAGAPDSKARDPLAPDLRIRLYGQGVRQVNGTLVGEVGAYATATTPAFNKVKLEMAGVPAPATATVPARRIYNFCFFFDDPFRDYASGGDGSRELYQYAPPGHDLSDHRNTGYVDHAYVKPGTYHIWAHTIDDQGAWSDRIERAIYINGPPTASFGYQPDPPLLRSPVTFTSTSKDHPDEDPEGDDPLAHAWDLDGDGAFDDGNGRTATRTYSSPPAGPVGLRVTDRWGTSRTERLTLQFDNRRPEASFSFSPASPHAGEPASFTSGSSDPDGEIVKWEWEFNGDGAYDDGSGATVSYAFARPGTYPASLRVTDERGLTAVHTESVAVSEPLPPPAASPIASPATPPSDRSSLGGATTSPDGAPSRPRVVRARIRSRAALSVGGVRVLWISVRAPKGATVRMRCRGRGCPRRAHRRRFASTLTWRRHYRSLRAGAQVRILVTQRGRTGRLTTLRIRTGAVPRRIDMCLRPTAGRPRRC